MLKDLENIRRFIYRMDSNYEHEWDFEEMMETMDKVEQLFR